MAFFLLSIIFFLLGILGERLSTTSINEICVFLLFVISAIFLSTGAVIRCIKKCFADLPKS